MKLSIGALALLILLATTSTASAGTHAGGYKECPTGQQVIIDVTRYGTLEVSFWTGSTDPWQHVHYEQNVVPSETFTPTGRQAASWSADAGGWNNAEIISAFAYCDG